MSGQTKTGCANSTYGRIVRLAFEKLGLVLSAIILIVMLVPWSRISADQGQALRRPGRYGGTLIYGAQQEPDILNPMVSSMLYTSMVSNMVYSNLVKVNHKMEIVPDLCTEVPTVENGGISPDFLTYTYHLRKGVRWTDGAPLTSKDVKFSYQTVMNPEITVTTTHGYDKIESVDTPDDHTVVFHLKEVYAPFVLIFSDYPILPEHILGRVPGKEFHKHPFNRKPVGTGPFKLVEWVSGSHMVLEANEDYYRGRPYVDRVIMKFIPDENTLFLQLKTGEIMGYDGANVMQYERLKKLPDIVVSETPALAYEHVDLNTESPILQDVRVRRAIGYAINRRQISDKIFKGLWKPAYSDQNPLSWAYNPEVEDILIYDPVEAERLLEGAGWKPVNDEEENVRMKDGRRLRLELSTTSGRPNRERVEVVLRDQLRRVGIDLEIRNYNASLFFGNYDDGGILSTGKYQMGMYAWVSGPDPDNYPLWAKDQIPPRGQNNTRFRDDRMTELLASGTKVMDRDERKKIYFEAQRILAQKVPMVPLLYWVNIDPHSACLRNFLPNPTSQSNTWNCYEWWLENSPAAGGR